MCKVLILDDEVNQWEWLRAVVLEYDPHCHIVPSAFVPVQSYLHKDEPSDWVESVLDRLEGETPDIAIVDLYLSLPIVPARPEGLWILNKLAAEFPDCRLILVTAKASLSAIPPLPASVVTVSISATNADRFSQLTEALHDAAELIGSH